MLCLADIMSTEVVTVSPELAVRDAMDLFVAEHISGAPVVSGQRVVGVVTTTDLLTLAAGLPGAPALREPPAEIGEWEDTNSIEAEDEPTAAYFTEMWEDAGADVAERTATSSTPEWNVLAEHTVSEAMTTALRGLPPETEVPRAAEYMEKHGIHRVLVMDGDRLLGIVTTSDISAAVAKHKLTERRFVFGDPQVRADGSYW
jgi:CBS domain-containing protein